MRALRRRPRQTRQRRISGRIHRSWTGGTLLVAATACALAAAAPSHAAPTWLGFQTISAAGEDGGAPQIGVAADGAATAVWYGDLGGSFQILAATRPRGGTWSASQVLSVPGQSAYNPQVAVAADGTATALWTRNDGPLSRIQVSTRPRGGTWSPAQDLSDAGRAASGPRIAAADDGTTTVVWLRSDGSNNRVQAAVRPSGGVWGAAQDLSPAGQDASAVNLAAAADGTTTVVWNRGASRAHRVEVATRPAGGAWSAVQQISTVGHANSGPDIATDGDGTVTIVWSSDDGDSLRAQSATRADGASWSPPQDISRPSRYIISPRLTVADDGTVAAVWTAVQGSLLRVQSAIRPAGGAWSAAESVSEPGSDTPFAQIVVGPDGTATAIWDRSESGSWIETATRPAGGTWSAPERLSPDGRTVYGAQLAISPDGTVAASWSEFDENPFSRLQASSRPSGGRWSAPELISDADRSAGEAQLVADGDGDFTAAWSEFDGSRYRRIQAATLDVAGPALDDLVVPTTGTVGQPIAVSVDPRDVWSALGDTTWSFGDGANAAGTSATHTYTAPGHYPITVTSHDEHGNQTTETRSITIDVAPEPPPGPSTPILGGPAPVPASCEARFVSLVGIEGRGTRRTPTVRLTAVAARSLAGRTATILRNDRPIATTTIPADGNVTTVVAAPRRAASRVRARYRVTTTAHGITTSSGAHRPSGRALITRRTALGGGRVRVQGRIAGIRRPTRLAVTGIALCGMSATTATTIRTDKRGRFTAILTSPDGSTATIYRVRYGRTAVTLPTVSVRP